MKQPVVFCHLAVVVLVTLLVRATASPEQHQSGGATATVAATLDKEEATREVRPTKPVHTAASPVATPPASTQGREPTSPPTQPVAEAPKYERVIVLGDLHGDLVQAVRGMQAAGVISLQPNYYNDLPKVRKTPASTKFPATAQVTKPPKRKAETPAPSIIEFHNPDSASQAEDVNYVNSRMVSKKIDPKSQLVGTRADSYHWSAGQTLVVCTGDAMNVGPDDLGLIRLVMRLTREARAVGGHFEFLLGNHEVRNLNGDFDGVHPWSFEQSGGKDGRAVMLSMKTDIGSYLRTRKVLFLYNGFLFLHGGMTAKAMEAFKEYLDPFNPTTFIDRVNDAVMRVLVAEGRADELPRNIQKLAELVLNVDYAVNADVNPLLIHPLDKCEEVNKANQMFGGIVHTQVVGHTPHKLPKFVFCDGALFAIDFSNSKWKGGKTAVVTSLLLGAPSIRNEVVDVARASTTDAYENERTLGTWVAALSVTQQPTPVSLEEMERVDTVYRTEILALALVVAFLVLYSYRSFRRENALRNRLGLSPTW